jgi:hypothetical protein
MRLPRLPPKVVEPVKVCGGVVARVRLPCLSWTLRYAELLNKGRLAHKTQRMPSYNDSTVGSRTQLRFPYEAVPKGEKRPLARGPGPEAAAEYEECGVCSNGPPDSGLSEKMRAERWSKCFRFNFLGASARESKVDCWPGVQGTQWLWHWPVRFGKDSGNLNLPSS